MINITEEQLKEIVTQAHMAGQHNQTGCDPSYFEAETHWQKQVKNLGLFSVSGSALDIAKQIPQVPQTQMALNNQLKILRIAANRLGLYDAADFIKRD